MIDTKEEQIRLYARQLKIPTFANYADTIRQCAPDTDFSGFLLELMMAEAASRQENQTRRRMKAAAFPFQKTLDEFDMTQLNPSVSPVFLNELASCKFIDACRNIVMIGNPGRGKTHIAIALGIKACLQGYRVLFRNASTLSTELTEARDSYQLGKIERQLARTDLLILDELSYPDLMDIHQMSSALGISTKTGYKLIREGKIIARKVGRTYRISKMHLLMYINMLAQDNTRKTS